MVFRCRSMLREASVAAMLIVGAGVLGSALRAFGPRGALAGFVLGPLSTLMLAIGGMVARFALQSLAVQVTVLLLAAGLSMSILAGRSQMLNMARADINTLVVFWIAGFTGLAVGMCFPLRRGRNVPDPFERRA